MNKKRHLSRQGFTIVELLIVIVVIAILAAISIVGYNGIQVRARDSIRAQDIAQIQKYALMYNVTEGGLPKTQIYGEDDAAGFDTSSGGGWMTFLTDSNPSLTPPVDPINDTTTNPTLSGYTYFYYCYDPDTDGWSPIGTSDVARFGYRSEQTGQIVLFDSVIDTCQTS